jgi:hypothetical protein
LILVAGRARVATLNIIGGQLMRASGVIAAGSSYDVAFLDGTYIALHSGCDESSDFTFQTAARAALASQALLDQVFLDDIDVFGFFPDLTNGTSDPERGFVGTPRGLADPVTFPGQVEISFANNFGHPSRGNQFDVGSSPGIGREVISFDLVLAPSGV